MIPNESYLYILKTFNLSFKHILKGLLKLKNNKSYTYFCDVIREVLKILFYKSSSIYLIV